MSGEHADREFRTLRLLPFPREAVWAAWVDRERLARWWGPAGFTNLFEHFEARPGGTWRFTMIGPEGARFRNESEFVVLERPSRIVLHHVSPPVYDLEVTLVEDGEATRLDWCQRFESAKVAATVRRIVAAANEQNLDRLEAELRR